MPRFYFHVRDRRGFERDLEGADFPDIEAARFEALAAGKARVADYMMSGKTLDGALEGQFEIADETGATVLTVAFSEAAQAEDHRP